MLGYEMSYEVSDLGRVRSIPRRGITRGRILKQWPDTHGYLRVGIGKGNVMSVHRLVLDAFVGPKPATLQTRHRNGNKLDNSLSNLTYGTASENIYDVVEHGNHYQRSKTHCRNDHEYNEENTRIDQRGWRVCRVCIREKARAYRAERRARTGSDR